MSPSNEDGTTAAEESGRLNFFTGIFRILGGRGTGLWLAALEMADDRDGACRNANSRASRDFIMT